MKDKRVQVRTDLPQSLALQMKLYAVRHNMKLYEVYEQATKDFLTSKKIAKDKDQQDLFLVSH